MNKKLITTKELCSLLSISKSTVERYRKRGMPYYLVVNRPRFCFEEVLEWVQNHSQHSEKDTIEDYVFNP